MIKNMGLEVKSRQEIKKYSPEENRRIRDTVLELRSKFIETSPEKSGKLEGEIETFVDRLRENYNDTNVVKYAMWHALGGSGINPNREADILYEDFPGNDSVKKFVNELVEKYK